MHAGEDASVEELSDATVDQVVDVLCSMITPARKRRIDEALRLRTRKVVIVLEDVENEHNGAAVLRTAEAFGFFEVHVVESSNGRFQVSRRVAKGTQKWLDLRMHTSTDAAYAALRARGLRIWASTVRPGAIDIHDVPISQPLALVFGNELKGLTRSAVEQADGFFRIPMCGFVESFNVSVAAAISTYDVWLRRRAASLLPGLSERDEKRVRAVWLSRSVRSARAVLRNQGLPMPVAGAQGRELFQNPVEW